MTNAVLATAFPWNVCSTLFFTIYYQPSLAWLLLMSVCTDPGLHLFSTSACSSEFRLRFWESDYAHQLLILPDFADHLPAARKGSANHLPAAQLISTEQLPAAQPVSADYPLAAQPVFADVLPAARPDFADIQSIYPCQLVATTIRYSCHSVHVQHLFTLPEALSWVCDRTVCKAFKGDLLFALNGEKTQACFRALLVQYTDCRCT